MTIAATIAMNTTIAATIQPQGVSSSADDDAGADDTGADDTVADEAVTDTAGAGVTVTVTVTADVGGATMRVGACCGGGLGGWDSVRVTEMPPDGSVIGEEPPLHATSPRATAAPAIADGYAFIQRAPIARTTAR